MDFHATLLVIRPLKVGGKDVEKKFQDFQPISYVACSWQCIRIKWNFVYQTPLILKTPLVYSQTSLVSTPEDPPNCYSLSVVLANHKD